MIVLTSRSKTVQLGLSRLSKVQINRYAVAHPNVIGQFITQKLPIALSCHAQLVEIMDGTKREFPI